MNSLIGNGVNLYRRNGNLVRSPIVVNVQPSSRAYYAIAGGYVNELPRYGFNRNILNEGSTLSATRICGENMTNAYFNIPQYQRWRSVNTAHDPECVWYQGAYSTSANSISIGKNMSEAFVQCCAYKFEKPAGLKDLTCIEFKVNYICGGFVSLDGSIADGSAVPFEDPSLNQDGDGIFYISKNLDLPCDLTTGKAGISRTYGTLLNCVPWDGGFRDLWGLSGHNQDGGIPCARQPLNLSISFDATKFSPLNIGSEVWVIATPNIGYEGSQYFPYYGAGSRNRWKCHALWGLTAEMTLE